MFCLSGTLQCCCAVLTKHDSLDTWGQMKTQPWGNTLKIEPFVYIYTYMRQQHVTLCYKNVMENEQDISTLN